MVAKILLVDDDLTLLYSVSSYLMDEGFCVDTASEVSMAIKMLQSMQYDLIVSDIVLPGQNGYHLIHYLQHQEQLESLPFIFLTAKGMTKDRILGYDLGCYAYLTKPFDPAELVSIIRNVLLKAEKKEAFKIIKKSYSDDIQLDQLILQKKNAITSLTEREKCVLQLVLRGMTNKEIASELNVSVRNIEKYVSRLLAKTNTRNRTQLSQYFYHQSLFDNKGE
uniref:TctD-like protein n=1 Tax=Helminthocladia australis TaxID=260093 RepID=A0A1G4NTN6_9FLOR|nr:Hypothetical protein ycf29 [Helminthocladia australis]SCW22051.1 Hypothetical protein ycf29 [Helminthocladia australis]